MPTTNSRSIRQGQKKAKARPGRGLASGEAKPARIAAPTNPRIADSATAARRKLSRRSEGQCRNLVTFLRRDVACNVSLTTIGTTKIIQQATNSRDPAHRADKDPEDAQHQRREQHGHHGAVQTSAKNVSNRFRDKIRMPRPEKKQFTISDRKVPRYSKRPKIKTAAAVAPTIQRHMISARVSEGRRKAARNPSAVGEIAMCAQDNSFSRDPRLVPCHPERSGDFANAKPPRSRRTPFPP